ncbi:PREDICTED: uncharacterized protein LOC108569170 [Nicrophorus vespilloides]|uniref:Uncharacterized protein LOC108569170 n=1 Tax=Nicrophorus vespilloides TaxID=110193 RepID=A0ABM1NH08_NICVS|nr:PREDICTED: uncharacterized protein LOC108569170 [Nicrophorus vespilloides]
MTIFSKVTNTDMSQMKKTIDEMKDKKSEAVSKKDFEALLSKAKSGDLKSLLELKQGLKGLIQEAKDKKQLPPAAHEIVDPYLSKAKKIDAKYILDLMGKGLNILKKKLDEPVAKPGERRPMKFPYTFSAKIAQFPWVYYAKNNWIYRYYFISLICCLPIFSKISKLSNSEGNKKKWQASLDKEEAEYKEHHH